MAGERLKADIESPEFRAGVHHEFWRLRLQLGDLLYIELLAPDGRTFVAEFNCSSYETEPLSCRFVDKNSLKCTTEAWPKGDATLASWLKWDPQYFFICWPQDRRAIDGYHQEWRQLAAWTKTTNKLVTYLGFLQELLYVPERGYLRQSR